MSIEYANKFKGKTPTQAERKAFFSRPGKLKDGKPVYTTEQAHKDDCDINSIVKRYKKTGVISHVSRFEANYGDMTGDDFKTSTDKILKAKQDFKTLPANIRKEFKNNPAKLLEFMENPDNRDKAIELGIIDRRWTPETDGIGEHIKDGENKIKTDPPADPAVTE